MVVYEANLLYSRNPPAACVFAAFSGIGIKRFKGRPESLAEYPAAHASSLYYPYRNPYSYRNGRKIIEAFVTGLEPYIRHFTVRSLCPASGPSVRLSHGGQNHLGSVWLRQDQQERSRISADLYQSCQSCFYLYIPDTYLS